MKMSFEQAAFEDASIFTSPGEIEIAWYGYLAMLHSFGWSHQEYCNELLSRIDKGWTDVQDQTYQS